MSAAGPQGGRRPDSQQNIAAAIADVSERASVLVREEIELAKAEVTEKVTKLVKGAIVGAAAGIFFVFALVFVLVGCAWLLYWFLPVADFAYFWGFFAMAAILVVLGVIAGWIAARAVKKGSPPVPSMAIEEAQKIRQAVSSTPSSPAAHAPPPPYTPPPAASAPPPVPEPAAFVSDPAPAAFVPEPAPSEPESAAFVPESAAFEPAVSEPVPAASEPAVPGPETAVSEPVPAVPDPEPAVEQPAPVADQPPVEPPTETMAVEHPAVDPGYQPGGEGLAADAIFNRPRPDDEEEEG